MKKLVLFIFVISIGLFANSCNKLIGTCDKGFELSQNDVRFDSKENIITISTQKSNWWINQIQLNEKRIDNSVSVTNQQNFIIENPEFKFERINGNRIIISMPENNTNVERVLNIGLQDGNCFGGIRVTQAK